MNEEQKADLEAELKSSLADFIDHQQRALTAAGRACDAWGTPAFESHVRVAGATSLAGLRRLVRNFADVAAECEAAGLCGDDADKGVERQGPATGGNQDGVRVRLRVNED